MNDNELLKKIKNVLDSRFFGVLATQADEYPYCTLVSYVNSDDCENIIFATNKDTHKYKNLKKHPNVSILIDTQTNNQSDVENAKALTVLGRASEVNVDLKSKLLGTFLKKHPYLNDFVSSPGCALINIDIHKYILVEKFQDVMEYNML